MMTNANNCRCNSLKSSSNRLFSPLLLQQPQTLQTAAAAFSASKNTANDFLFQQRQNHRTDVLIGANS